MNIWMFNHNAYSPDLPGGTRHFDLAGQLVKRGHMVTIFATSFHHHLHKETRLQPGEDWKIEEVDGVFFVWIRTPPYQRNDWRRVWNMVAFMIKASRLGKRILKLTPKIERPDVIIGSSPDLLTPVSAYWVARQFKVPFVMEVRDLWPQTIIDMGALGPSHPIIKTLQVLEKFLYQRSDRIISLLPLAYEYITNCGIPREKIIWVPNGVDLSRFNTSYMESSSHDGFLVMYLGAHGQANALDVLIQAAKIVQDKGYSEIRFVLMGDGPEKPRLMALAEELGLADMEFCDPIPKGEVPNVLQNADATIFILNDLPLYGYGISLNKLSDYLAASKPLILAGNPSNNPVSEAKCGLTTPAKDPDALAEAIINLYKMSPEERENMGRRGRDYVAEYHDISRLARMLEQTLTQIIEGVSV